MKRFIKATSIFVCLFILLGLAACGNNGEDNSPESADYMAADELTGVWADGDKNMLQLDTAQNTYTYRTWYGRIGNGSLITPENDENVRQLDFDDFYYDCIIADGGFTLRQNGENEEENLNGAHFVRTDGEMVQISPETLDGMWQNAAGETLVIDTGRMAYIACSKQGISSGTVAVTTACFIRTEKRMNMPLLIKRTLYHRTDICGTLTACNTTLCPMATP